jgi:hypothetical protein
MVDMVNSSTEMNTLGVATQQIFRDSRSQVPITQNALEPRRMSENLTPAILDRTSFCIGPQQQFKGPHDGRRLLEYGPMMSISLPSASGYLPVQGVSEMDDRELKSTQCPKVFSRHPDLQLDKRSAQLTVRPCPYPRGNCEKSHLRKENPQDSQVRTFDIQTKSICQKSNIDREIGPLFR